jgi:virginiamycin B lyase
MLERPFMQRSSAKTPVIGRVGVVLKRRTTHLVVACSLSTIGCAGPPAGQPWAADVTIHDDAAIIEYELDWEQVGATAPLSGSTHELIFDQESDGDSVWITGQDYDGLLKMDASGEQTYFSMPTGSGPHGLAYDVRGQLLVSLEYDGSVATVSEAGDLLEIVDVTMAVDGGSAPINPAPHGIAVDGQGTSTWFTGKRTSSIGRIDPDGSVEHFELDTLAAMPIYLHAGPQGGVWGTELLGNKILHVDDDDTIREYPIPTRNSRPIAIALGPDENMWFSEEAGRKVARISAAGDITEFDVPITQPNMLLAGLAFDDEGNLWTHGYIDPNDPEPAGDDYIIRIDADVVDVVDGDMSNIQVDLYRVPTRNTVMHRIMQGPDRNIWFTELGTDKLGILPLP